MCIGWGEGRVNPQPGEGQDKTHWQQGAHSYPGIKGPWEEARGGSVSISRAELINACPETSLSPSLPLKDLSKPCGARLEFKPN